MANENAKQAISETRGSFNFVGIISNLDKNQQSEKTTSKGNAMRELVFNLSTAEGHTHRMQIRAYQQENTYFVKNFEENGERKRDIKQVKWADRKKFQGSKDGEGYFPIDLMRYHFGKVIENGKEISSTKTNLTFDAIPELLEEFNTGDSVRVIGNIQIEDYTLSNGNTGTAVRLIPHTIYHTSEPVDFTKEDFKEYANFNQKILFDEVEKTGTNEATVTGIVIGNQRIGKQDFIFRGDAYEIYQPFLESIGSLKKYVAAEVQGILANTVETEDDGDNFIVLKGGARVPRITKRPAAKSFIREFLVTGILTGEDGEAVDYDSYNEENVQEFIDGFVRARQEFGKTTKEKEEEAEKIGEDFSF